MLLYTCFRSFVEDDQVPFLRYLPAIINVLRKIKACFDFSLSSRDLAQPIETFVNEDLKILMSLLRTVSDAQGRDFYNVCKIIYVPYVAEGILQYPYGTIVQSS